MSLYHVQVQDTSSILLKYGAKIFFQAAVPKHESWKSGKDVPSQLPFHASFLYSRNVVNLLSLFTTPAKDDQKVAFNLDFEDEIINGAAVTHAGARRGAK